MLRRLKNLISKPTIMRNQKGMTLIEIMIVLVIIGGLMTVLATQVMPKLFKAQGKTAKIQITNIMSALDLYYTDCQNYPSTEEGLRALLQRPESCRGNWGPDPYLKKESDLNDPWGTEFYYEFNGSTPLVKSYGKNRVEGGSGNDEDISSEDL